MCTFHHASFLDRAELIDGVKALISKAKSPELREFHVLDLSGSELPWKDLGITLTKGQEVTFLLGGRVFLSREHDLWVEPGVALHVRTRGTRPMFNPMGNTGTMTATADGPLEMARSLVEFQNEEGELAVPKDAYAKADAHIYGLALVWRGKALAGLASLLTHGDVCGVIGAELARLQSPRKLPAGWHNFFMLGGGPVIFNDIGNGAVSCRAAEERWHPATARRHRVEAANEAELALDRRGAAVAAAGRSAHFARLSLHRGRV